MTDQTDQIATVEALDALPDKAVILEATTRIAYQKCGTYWDGDAREWGSAQIALPAIVLWLPFVVAPHEHRWISTRAMTDTVWTFTCACGATYTEEEK